MTDNELRVNQELYKRLIELTKNSLKPLYEYENLKPEYKEWAKNRSIHISTAANMRDLFELVDQLKFHSSEWKEFLVSKKNFELYAKSEIEDISMRTCPIFFMNYKSSDDKDKERNNLKNSFKITIQENKNIIDTIKELQSFPGDRMIHHDFITGEVAPENEKNIGKTYASIQIYNFDKVICKGNVSKNVPYFNVYPASDLWVDITRVE